MNDLLIKYKNLEKLSKKNEKLAYKILRITYLLQNNIKLYTGPKGGLFYYSKNKNKIYLN
tara:strand:- start:2294 stop:2473 length:180 start_codon:yes stop_codon:yes gene_type:complete